MWKIWNGNENFGLLFRVKGRDEVEAYMEDYDFHLYNMIYRSKNCKKERVIIDEKYIILRSRFFNMFLIRIMKLIVVH